MPYLLIQTNQSMDDTQRHKLMQKSSRLVADLLGKSENYVMVAIQSSVSMLFAGNDQPLAYLQLKSLGLSESSTVDYSKSLCELMNQVLDINPNRIYIEFFNSERHMWGWNQQTF